LRSGSRTGLIAVNDDWRHRVILIDPRSKKIVWQYGHTDVASAAPGYLSKPDGMDFLPAFDRHPVAPVSVARSVARSPTPTLLSVARAGSLPAASSRLSAVALPGGRIMAFGGIKRGTSSAVVLAGPPAGLRGVGALPAATHDAAAVLTHGNVELFGGGRSVSTPDVTLVEPATGKTRIIHPLDEPLSDLGAAVVGGQVYLVGGYTGARYASAVLRVGSGGRTTTVARLPNGVRYAGVAAQGGAIYVAGGVTPAGATRDVYRVDVRHGTVTRVATLPEPVAHAPLVASGGFLWLIGGTDRGTFCGSIQVGARSPLPRVFLACSQTPRRSRHRSAGSRSSAETAQTPSGCSRRGAASSGETRRHLETGLLARSDAPRALYLRKRAQQGFHHFCAFRWMRLSDRDSRRNSLRFAPRRGRRVSTQTSEGSSITEPFVLGVC